jgi:hypothetical protein
VFAVLACVAFFALVPLMLYGSWVIPRAVSTADLGGPLNFVLIPLAGSVLGLAVSIVIFLPLSLLAERYGIRHWCWLCAACTVALIPVVVVAALSVNRAGGQATRWLPVLVCTALALYLVAGFLIYLGCVAMGRKVLP